MVIGISSAELFSPSSSIRERVTLAMVYALQKADKTNRYIIFSKYARPEGLSLAENFSFRLISTLGNVVGDQIILPRVLKKSGCDVLLNMGFTGPLNLQIPHLYMFPSFWGRFLWDKLYGVVEYRGDRQSFYRRFVSKRLIFASTKLILSSHYEKENLVQRYWPEIDAKRLSVVQAGITSNAGVPEVNRQFEKLAEIHGLPEHFILTFDDNNPLSNIATVLLGYKRMVDVLMVKTPLVMVGAKREMVQSVVGEEWLAKHSEKVFMVNKLKESEKSTLFVGALAYIAPSFYDKWCLDILDAISFGVPIVTSIQSSLAEVANGAAILVDPKNEIEISEACRRILIDKKCLQGLTKKGLERATVYQWQNTAQKLLSLLEQYQK